MGCKNSSLHRRHGHCEAGFKKNKDEQRQAISLVTQRACFSQERSKNRVRSWSPDHVSLCNGAVLVLQNDYDWLVVEDHLESRKAPVGFLDHANAGTRGNDEPVERLQGNLSDGSSPATREVTRLQLVLPRLHLLESPVQLCPEQERRLRCANLEVTARLSDLSSDGSDDEGDGFEFAKLESSVFSLNSEHGEGVGSIPDGDARSQNSEGLITDISLSGTWERLQSSSISESELQVNASPGYVDLPSADSDNLLLSPASVDCSEVSSSGIVLEECPANGVDQVNWCSSLSEDSRYFPGFTPKTPDTVGLDKSFPTSPSFRNNSIGDASPFIEERSGTPPSYEWSPAIVDSDWDRSSPCDSLISQWGQSSLSESPCVGVICQTGFLIPGLPNDLAQMCLMRVPFIKYDCSYRMVCRQWRAVLSSEEFFRTRNALGIQEAHISFVVHGNRVQIFSLRACRWFCLPPLPRDDGQISPSWRVPSDWVQSPGSHSSPESALASDLGIDPYDWWQIDSVAVSEGTLYVIGGDQAELHSFIRPSKATNKVHKYDFCQNCWVTVSQMEVPRSHAAAVCIGKFIYVAGGSADIEEGASAEVYDSEQNTWTIIPSMNTSMRMCVGLEHKGCLCVKGESIGPGSGVEGEIFDLKTHSWEKMTSGMRRGLERGPVASCNSNLFVADWHDSLLKVYSSEEDTWVVLAKLPARISRLVGHASKLYGLTGKIKVDPYNHHVISDAPAEVWRLDLGRGFRHLYNTSLTSVWECLWRDPRQMVKTGGLAWVPCIAHCTLFED